MICVGHGAAQKLDVIDRYQREHGIAKTFVLYPKRFPIDAPGVAESDCIEWADIIRYRYFYRLLREIDQHTLIVIHECLRTQNRHELTFNCIRHFLQQTEHQIVFQRFPIIDTFDDFMILVDLDTRSRWKRERWNSGMLAELTISVSEKRVALRRVDVPTDAKMRDSYARKKRQLIDDIGLRDPHTIPRNLHLHAGKVKVAMVEPEKLYVGRNQRFKLPNLETYKDARGPANRTVFEFPHRFIDWTDFLAATDTGSLDALVSDLKVDVWYFERFTRWGERLDDAYKQIA